MKNLGTILVAHDADSLALFAAHLFRGLVGQALAERPVARVAISGGSTPRVMNRLLAGMSVPWGRVEVFFVDERAVPPSHERSNYGATRADLFAKLPTPPRGLYAMPGASPSVEEGAAAYAKALGASFGAEGIPRFDAVFLGVGDDGHTASLFPGDDTIDVVDRWVTGVPAAEGREARITLTRPVITAARTVVVLAQGAAKRGPIALARGEGSLREIPSRLTQQVEGELLWVLDAAAVPGP